MPDEDVLDKVEVTVGGMVFLIDQPMDDLGFSHMVMVMDEDKFIKALGQWVEGLKWVGEVTNHGSITLINGIIPVTVEVPDGCEDLDAWAAKTAERITKIWKKFAG